MINADLLHGQSQVRSSWSRSPYLEIVRAIESGVHLFQIIGQRRDDLVEFLVWDNAEGELSLHRARDYGCTFQRSMSDEPVVQ